MKNKVQLHDNLLRGRKRPHFEEPQAANNRSTDNDRDAGDNHGNKPATVPRFRPGSLVGARRATSRAVFRPVWDARPTQMTYTRHGNLLPHQVHSYIVVRLPTCR